MRFLTIKLLTATALSLSLAACVPDPSLVEAGIVEAPAPKIVEGVYSSKNDGTFTVPAVPVEKVPSEFQRQTVYYPTEEPVGTVIINPAAKHLYLVTARNQATRYGIAVGKAGFQWSGEALITNRRPWPTWTPPSEMISRKPELAQWEKGQPGGLTNPLGARALYLTTNGVDYGYRIHGTPEWDSIGKNASSGCIRMINQDVMDLYERVLDGAKVVVLNADGSYPNGLKLPPKPAAAKKKPAVAVPATAVADATPSAPVLTAAPAALPGASQTVLPAATTPTATTPTANLPTTATPAAAPATPAPAATLPAPTVAPAAATPAAPVTSPSACMIALVNGICPQG